MQDISPEMSITFQFTSPQGDERAGGLCKIIQWYFNSRLRKETNVSDRFPLFPLFGISTRVSARRRTFDNILNKTCNLFQLTSP